MFNTMFNANEIQTILISLEHYQKELGKQFEKDQKVCQILGLHEDGLAPLQARIVEIQNLLEDLSNLRVKDYPVTVVCNRCQGKIPLNQSIAIGYVCNNENHQHCEEVSSSKVEKLHASNNLSS